MKSKTFFFYGMLFSAIWNLTAQNNTDIPTLLSRLDQSHATSITSVFTASEIEILRTHFDAQDLATGTTTQSILPTTVHATENTNGNFGSFSSSSPSTFTIAGTTGATDFEGAGAYDEATQLYYVIDTMGNAYVVDAVSGIYAPLPSVTPPAGESYTGLEFDPETGNLFGISTDGVGKSTLSMIDPQTGNVVILGDTELVLAIALAFNSTGNVLYTYDLDDDIMYEVDKLTGDSVALGPLTFDANFGQGMFLSAAGQIYLTAFNNDTFRSELRMLNTNTGGTSLISTIGDASFPGQTLQFAWASAFESILTISDRNITSFALYPNPTGELLTVSHIQNLEHITIITMTGQTVLDMKVNEMVHAIDVSNLTTGNYLVQITTARGSVTRQLIKK